MADFYVKSGQATERANSTAYALGNKMVPLSTDTSTNHAVAKRWVWECTVAGTSGAAVPTWPASVTQDTTTVTDGTVTWRARKPGFSSGTTANWTFAHPFLYMMLSGTAAGDRIFVSNNHNSVENNGASTVVYTFPGTTTSPTYVYCVDDTTTDPALMTLATTAVTTTAVGGVGLQFGGGVAYIYGITFVAGSSTNNHSITVGGVDQAKTYLDNCKLRLGATGTGSRIIFGSTTANTESEAILRNTTLRFSNSSQFGTIQQFRLDVQGGGIESGGVTPSAAFLSPNSGVYADFVGFDLSQFSSTVNLVANTTQAVGLMWFRYCRLPASWTGNLSAGTSAARLLDVRTISCDSAGDVKQNRKNEVSGNIFTDTVVVRTGGAAFAWRMVTNANAEYPPLALSTPEIYFYNSVTGSSRTLTVEVITNNNITLTDKDLWVDVFALNTAGQTQATLVSSIATNPLASATNLPSSSETWDTTGLTNPVKQKVSVTFTPQVAGDFIAIVRLARASTTTYVDPAVVVT